MKGRQIRPYKIFATINVTSSVRAVSPAYLLISHNSLCATASADLHQGGVTGGFCWLAICSGAKTSNAAKRANSCALNVKIRRMPCVIIAAAILHHRESV